MTRTRAICTPLLSALLPLLAAAALAATVAADAGGTNGTASLARLKAGNVRFAAGVPLAVAPPASLAGKQTPFAGILTCSDSHVPPELLFHTGPGSLFVVRAAGHVTDRAVLASLEYGAEQVQVPLLVVLGHEMCDAVRTTLETPAATSLGPNRDYLLKAIRPSVERAAKAPESTRLRVAILTHVEETINQLLETSPVLRRLTETQQIVLVGAYHEAATGRVHFSEPVSMPPRRVN